MNQPIGFWVKRLDRLIDDRSEALLTEAGATRRDWQVLNLLAETSRTLADIEAALAPFPDVAAATRKLLHHGHATEDETETIHLTDTGRALRVDLGGRIATLRELAVRGIEDHDYQHTIDTLTHMCRNLESGPVGAGETAG